MVDLRLTKFSKFRESVSVYLILGNENDQTEPF